MPSALAPVEAFTPEEAAALAPYFGNSDRPVFVLTNLPEAVKGALFARYSRSAKSARRLFLDEFLGESARPPGGASTDAGAPDAGLPDDAGAVPGTLPPPRPESARPRGRGHVR